MFSLFIYCVLVAGSTRMRDACITRSGILWYISSRRNNAESPIHHKTCSDSKQLWSPFTMNANCKIRWCGQHAKKASTWTLKLRWSTKHSSLKRAPQFYRTPWCDRVVSDAAKGLQPLTVQDFTSNNQARCYTSPIQSTKNQIRAVVVKVVAWHSKMIP